MKFFRKTEKKRPIIMNEEIYRRWEEAYRANPRVYEKKDGTLIVGFALTEDTDSIFPICPENQFAIDIEGKTISEWIITMVCTAKLILYTQGVEMGQDIIVLGT